MFLLVFALGVLLRLGVAAAYRPALLYSDSWAYIDITYGRTPVGIGAAQPSGYPLLIRLITVPARRLELITAAQHLAGLAIGAIVYVLLLRLGTRRWLAAVAAALILLDGYAITLEQYVMSETFFTLALLTAMYITLALRRTPRTLAAAGVLIAIAATIRVVGLVALPVWILFLLLSRSGKRGLAAGVAGAAIPLLAYLSMHAALGAGFRLTTSEGWLLYGRVGAFADCRGSVPESTRSLCAGDPDRRPKSPAWYVWNGSSPARREFTRGMTARSNRLLRGFAIATIEEHPRAYAELVGSDFLRYFRPDGGGIGSAHPNRGTPVDPLVLPDRRSPEWKSAYSQRVRKSDVPSYKGLEIHWPAAALRSYREWVHTQRWLIAVFTVAALAALLGSVSRALRRAVPRGRDVFLLSLTGLALLLAPLAVDYFKFRFVIPALPLLVCGGTIALDDMVSAIDTARLPLFRSPRRMDLP